MTELLIDKSSFYPEALLYPKLSDDMVRRSVPYGAVRQFAQRSEIHKPGARCWDFLIVLEGELLVTCPTALEGEIIVSRHHGGEFVGNTYLLTEREMLVGLGASSGARTLSIPHEQFRRYLTSEPDIADIIVPAFMYRCMSLVAQMQGGALVIGPRQAADTLRIQRFLSGNRHPNRLLDPEIDPEAEGILAAMKLTMQEFPVVIAGSTILRNPDNATLAESLGLFEAVPDGRSFDVAIVGAGPAGLAAAVYAASEGLQTVVIEGESPGGQAGTSSRIENYLGFPAGISGADLAALAQAQAQKFGAKLVVSQNVSAIQCGARPFVLHLERGKAINAKKRDHRDRRSLPHPKSSEFARVRNGRHPLLRYVHRGSPLSWRGSHRRGRREFGWSSGDVLVRLRQPCAYADSRIGARRQHVGVSRQPDPRFETHHAASRKRDRRT